MYGVSSGSAVLVDLDLERALALIRTRPCSNTTRFRARITSSTARAGTSPLWRRTRAGKPAFSSRTSRVFGLPRSSWNLGSRIHPVRARALRSSARRSGVTARWETLRRRRISARVRPVVAATLDWLTLPVDINAVAAAESTSTSLAISAICFAVIPAARRSEARAFSSRRSVLRIVSLPADWRLRCVRGLFGRRGDITRGVSGSHDLDKEKCLAVALAFTPR